MPRFVIPLCIHYFSEDQCYTGVHNNLIIKRDPPLIRFLRSNAIPKNCHISGITNMRSLRVQRAKISERIAFV